MRKIGIILFATIIVIIAGCSQTGTGGNIKACTKEAKLCPDGSAVGRTGPDCEFAPCPEPDDISSVEVCGPMTFTEYQMTFTEAKQIAKASECGDNLMVDCTCPDGYRKDGETCTPECYYSTPRCLAPSIQCEKGHFCNEGTRTWWINLNMTKQGCSPACVIHTDTKQAEINWRCTGLVQN